LIKAHIASAIADQKIKEGAGPNPADVMTGKRTQKAEDLNDEIAE
jgi:hypothetical protein